VESTPWTVLTDYRTGVDPSPTTRAGDLAAPVAGRDPGRPNRAGVAAQGHDAFVARDRAEWSQVRFTGGPGPAAEMALGSFAQAVRRP
jgi:hypothetical protein